MTKRNYELMAELYQTFLEVSQGRSSCTYLHNHLADTITVTVYDEKFEANIWHTDELVTVNDKIKEFINK